MEWAEEGQRGVTPFFELGYKKAVVEVGKKPQEEGGASADEWETQSDSSGEARRKRAS